ncbi:hypothetical protein, partial [Enterobacter kobei]|uniref:hypothetical protein n=1 Tax=Enterobacter kobei TaxID=208224 RepID=UPI0029D51C91
MSVFHTKTDEMAGELSLGGVYRDLAISAIYFSVLRFFIISLLINWLINISLNSDLILICFSQEKGLCLLRHNPSFISSYP